MPFAAFVNVAPIATFVPPLFTSHSGNPRVAKMSPECMTRALRNTSDVCTA
jgi:hypothetical protein